MPGVYLWLLILRILKSEKRSVKKHCYWQWRNLKLVHSWIKRLVAAFEDFLAIALAESLEEMIDAALMESGLEFPLPYGSHSRTSLES
jgi:hypothetical protein